jgi:hypothetical protein
MFQGKNLNLTDIPNRRAQEVPGPTVAADGVQVADHESRIAALEALVAALQATAADHETRITALEP